MASRKAILNWCDEILQTHTFKDYAPNGLQVEGREDTEHIVTAVTASRAAIHYAVEQQADMLLVHHGMFWKSEPLTVTGWKKERIAALLKHDINMAGYHLPLDAHPELGNNAQLAAIMGWKTEYCCGEQNLLNIGVPVEPITLAGLGKKLSETLQRKPVVIGSADKPVKRIAWCTGGAQGFFQTASDEGVDVYVTGEISEAQFHLAQETGTAFISAGHHATERYGIQALGKEIAQKFDVKVDFFDEQNPA